jgi:5'-nucleotidase
MKRKSIAIDLDSTLNTLDQDWIDAINKEYGTTLKVSDMKSWDPNTWKPEGCENVFECFKTPGWFDSLGVQPQAREVVHWLSQHYDLYIATAYHPNACVDKTNWVKRHFPMIDDQHIIFINPKHLLNTDYLIDDGPHNVEAFKQTGVLVDAPWNQHLGDKYPRLYDWNDIRGYFQEELAIDRSLAYSKKEMYM